MFDKARRVVIKVGSAILTDKNGINRAVVQNLAKEISFLHSSGREVILVTSGAVAAGKKKISFVPHGDISLPEKQAFAAIGQSSLMQTYEEAFARHGKNIAQILLTYSDLADRDRFLNVRNTIMTLFRFGVIPIINENDTVSVKELRFGDNDTLGALVTNIIEADMFICLTDVDGLYNGDPTADKDAAPIYTVAEITPEIEQMVGGSRSDVGTGGMTSKLKAAKMVTIRGGSAFIGPGRRQDILQGLFGGELVGTFFLPRREKMHSRKHWISFVLKPKGALVLDDGAVQAIAGKGKSLLPSGIQAVEGEFGVGDSVRCLAADGTVVAVGLISYSSRDVEKIKGLKSDQIIGVLGFKDSDEVIHRDNLVIL
ncbi:gamma-glutamyl kinase [Desulfobulbus sp. Tol-SR]|nr:gamma-glutamyl kinase [Desulfobulbus sp. Tol-SR]